MDEPTLHLLPSPGRVRWLGGVRDAGRAVVDAVAAARTGSLGSQAYRLVVHRDGAIEIEAGGPAGERFARRTLDQLVEQYGDAIPAVAIEDEPAFATRGVMLDVSRCRVPTMDEFRSIIALLGSMKINHLQLYIEHALAYRGHEGVWAGASPITTDELRVLDGWCGEAGIELGANQNCFGHLARWLVHERYAPLAETHGAFEFWGMQRKGPFSLCPEDPGSLALVEDLLGQQLACVQSGLVNIGCDETHDVGTGRSRGAVERDGYAAVYGRFVAGVARIARGLGRRAAWWADVALSHPGALDLLPADMLALAWGYEPTTPFGRWCKTLGEAGFEAWVCPGTSSWRSITGRTSERRANVAAAVSGGLAGGATGLLMTDWGDLGHRQVWPVALNGLAHAAEAAWTGRGEPPEAETVALRAFGDRTGETGRWLDELGEVDVALRRVGGVDASGGAVALGNASALFTELHPPTDRLGRGGSLADWEAVGGRIAQLGARVPGGAGAVVRDELALAAAEAAWACDVARSRRGGRAADLRGRLDGLVAEHRRVWAVRARQGGLDESMAILGGLGDGL